jgi:flagellar biosynthesis/type III secretory pathway ATPase
LLALHREKADLIAIGAYAGGSDERIDRAIASMPAIDAFLRQRVDEPSPAETSDAALLDLVAEAP